MVRGISGQTKEWVAANQKAVEDSIKQVGKLGSNRVTATLKKEPGYEELKKIAGKIGGYSIKNIKVKQMSWIRKIFRKIVGKKEKGIVIEITDSKKEKHEIRLNVVQSRNFLYECKKFNESLEDYHKDVKNQLKELHTANRFSHPIVKRQKLIDLLNDPRSRFLTSTQKESIANGTIRYDEIAILQDRIGELRDESMRLTHPLAEDDPLKLAQHYEDLSLVLQRDDFNESFVSKEDREFVKSTANEIFKKLEARIKDYDALKKKHEDLGAKIEQAENDKMEKTVKPKVESYKKQHKVGEKEAIAALMKQATKYDATIYEATKERETVEKELEGLQNIEENYDEIVGLLHLKTEKKAA